MVAETVFAWFCDFSCFAFLTLSFGDWSFLGEVVFFSCVLTPIRGPTVSDVTFWLWFLTAGLSWLGVLGVFVIRWGV